MLLSWWIWRFRQIISSLFKPSSTKRRNSSRKKNEVSWIGIMVWFSSSFRAWCGSLTFECEEWNKFVCANVVYINVFSGPDNLIYFLTLEYHFNFRTIALGRHSRFRLVPASERKVISALDKAGGKFAANTLQILFANTFAIFAHYLNIYPPRKIPNHLVYCWFCVDRQPGPRIMDGFTGPISTMLVTLLLEDNIACLNSPLLLHTQSIDRLMMSACLLIILSL